MRRGGAMLGCRLGQGAPREKFRNPRGKVLRRLDKYIEMSFSNMTPCQCLTCVPSVPGAARLKDMARDPTQPRRLTTVGA